MFHSTIHSPLKLLTLSEEAAGACYQVIAAMCVWLYLLQILQYVQNGVGTSNVLASASSDSCSEL